jgi:serine/threonine protein kinase
MDKNSILSRLVEVEDADERTALLQKLCADDERLKQQLVDALAERDVSVAATDFPSKPSDGTLTTQDLSTQRLLGKTLGPYKMLELLGEGGMGVVYLAQQDHPVQRRVAIKITKSGLDSQELLARFQAERQALALMDHENIAKVFDAGSTEDGRLFLVMELIKGIPITVYCDERRLKTTERLELFVSVCRAIQHAHQKGILHRDVKPSNVLVAEGDGKPIPKVIDFGLAKALQQQLTPQTLHTQLGQVLGTLEYMSPEQANFSIQDVDTRTDVYSLGVLLYELLTGTTPVGRNRLQTMALDEVVKIIREEEPSRPSLRLTESAADLPDISARRKTDSHRLREQFRGDLDAIVLKSLAKDRNRRYDSAAELAADIRRYLNDEPIEARPPSAIYLMNKFARRHRGLVAGIAAVLVALALGIGFSTWFALRASAQRKIAQGNFERAKTAERLASEAAVRAETQAALAQEQSDLAMQTLRDVIFQIQTPLAEIPAAREVRQEMLEMAITGLQKVAGNMNQRTDSNRSLMIALEDLGDIFHSLGPAADTDKMDHREFAEEQYQKALAIARKRWNEEPENHLRQYDLSAALIRLSWICQTNGRLAEAIEFSQKAAAIQESLAELDPNRYLGAFWSQCFGLSGMCFVHGDVNNALAWTRKAKQIGETVRQRGLDLKEPIPPHLAEEIEIRTIVFPMISSVHDDMELAFGQPQKVMERLLIDRAKFFIEENDIREAARTLSRLIEQENLTPSAYYGLACRYADCAALIQGNDSVEALAAEAQAEHESYCRSAVKMLRQAEQAGYFDDVWLAIAKINRDGDLDPLRHRPDFQQFLTELKSRE